MKMIQVLCLGMWRSNGEHDHIEVDNTEFLKGLKYLGNLRLLSLCGISRIRELPGSVSKLGDLRILDLRACYNLESLPREIKSLKTLTHLDISGCYLLDHMPKELKELCDLQVLKGFVITDVSHSRSACTLDDLAAGLKKLRKLSFNVNSEKFSIEDLWTTVVKFEQLEKLKIEWGGGSSQANHQHHPDNKSKKLETGEVKSKTTATATATATNVVDKKKELNRKVSVTNAAPAVPEKTLSRQRSILGIMKTKSKIGRMGIKLEKLELLCFPEQTLPKWLVPENLTSLKTLCIRGGGLDRLEKIQEGKVKWGVEDLRLKYLSELKIDWRELRGIFPHLKYLEKFKCPKVTFCPCDGSGVWVKSSTS